MSGEVLFYYAEEGFAKSSSHTLIEKGSEPNDFTFSLCALVGVVLLFIREVMAISAALQRRIINAFSIFKLIFDG